MPLTAPELVATGSNTASPLSISPTRDLQVGEILIVEFCERDNGITSVTDNSSQAGSANTYTMRTSQLSVDPFVATFSCPITRKILTTDSITINQPANFGGKGAIAVILANAINPPAIDVALASQTFATSSTYNSGTTGVNTAADSYGLGVAAFAVATVNVGVVTADSPWTLVFSAGPVSGYGCAFGTKIISTLSTQVFSGGWGVAEDGQQSAMVTTVKATAPYTPTDDLGKAPEINVGAHSIFGPF